MGLVDDYLSAFNVGKKEQMAARMAFFISGFTVATWAPMIPAVKEKLQIGADVLGLLLLSIGISAFIFMPLAGMMSRSFGCKKVLRVAIIVMALDLIVLSLLGSIWSFMVFLAVFGAAMGCMDVNMNLNAVIVENASKKRMMSGMHALWSVGCFAGAGLFSLLAKIGLGITVIVMLHSALVLVLTLIFSRHFLNFKGAGNEKPVAIPKGIVIFFGILACISFLGEGAIMDWSGVLLTEVKNTELSLAGIGYAVFSVAMLVMRLVGDKIVALLGEEKTLIGGSLIAALGFLSVIFLDDFYAIQFGFVLMGLGLANIVPTIYSLTKYQTVMPINAAVTAITSMGYTGVILGPAVLGFVAHGFGITQVFYLLAVLLAVQAAAVKYYFSERMTEHD
ncbi:MAG: MFS transporter [Phascolarctobacterium sp.]|nr:MAG: MFS transporter [Phascolarctobacterium sp.]